MTEALFYHLERRTLDDVLPELIEKTIARGWRALIRAESAERADAIDALLWTYNDQTFVAHAQMGDGDAARQPVLITVEGSNVSKADVMFLVGGAEPPAWDDASTSAFNRVVLMFDGRDPEMLARAREAWKRATSAGHDVTYWKESPSGKFEKQA